MLKRLWLAIIDEAHNRVDTEEKTNSAVKVVFEEGQRKQRLVLDFKLSPLDPK